MSINSAMLAGVSGLVTNSSALAAISDNIANVNTVGYKRNAVNFASVVTSQGVASRYSAGGVAGVTRQYVSQQGLIQAATSSTDLAISGDGFFIVTDKAAAAQPNDERLFTRAGAFNVDADGYLKNDANLYLQGWLVQPDGTFNTNPSDLTRLKPINVKGLGSAVTPTTEIKLAANVDKNALPADPVDMELTVIDAAGGSHTLQLTLTNTATPNQWTATLTAVPATDVSGAFAAGTVNFNQDGTIDLANSDLGVPGTTDIVIDASGGTAPSWSTALDLPAQTITVDLTKLTSRPSASAVDTVNQNGATAGSVVAVSVDEKGIVSAVYDNSQVRQIAKVGLATFANADGLQAGTGGVYRASLQSGQYVIKEPGVGSAGKIAASSLEASTVDLSSEFTGLIATQKAYSASSKIITTADQMLDELINIKR